MSNITLDSSALAEAANDLSSYIEEVKENIQKMQEAAQDCVDNMEKDSYSQSALAQITETISQLRGNLEKAEDLKRRILEKKNEIEESGKILG